MQGQPPPPPFGTGTRTVALPGNLPPPAPPGVGGQIALDGPKGPPPPPRGMPMPGVQPSAVSPGGRTLVVYFADERVEVTKDQFVIGRGKKATDLTIKDPNVSRTHAMVERVEGQYFIVDMGSTNGVLYKGQRVQRMPISGGDMFRIVKYDLRFEFE
jgi:hypothetical protein